MAWLLLAASMETYNENSKQKGMKNVQFIKERNVNVEVKAVDISHVDISVGADRCLQVYEICNIKQKHFTLH